MNAERRIQIKGRCGEVRTWAETEMSTGGRLPESSDLFPPSAVVDACNHVWTELVEKEGVQSDGLSEARPFKFMGRPTALDFVNEVDRALAHVRDT